MAGIFGVCIGVLVDIGVGGSGNAIAMLWFAGNDESDLRR